MPLPDAGCGSAPSGSWAAQGRTSALPPGRRRKGELAAGQAGRSGRCDICLCLGLLSCNHMLLQFSEKVNVLSPWVTLGVFSFPTLSWSSSFGFQIENHFSGRRVMLVSKASLLLMRTRCHFRCSALGLFFGTEGAFGRCWVLVFIPDVLRFHVVLCILTSNLLGTWWPYSLGYFNSGSFSSSFYLIISSPFFPDFRNS